MSSVLRFESHSDEDTLTLGGRLSALLPARGVVLLTGDLGAGKTTLAKGIVAGRQAASAGEVSSPTFTLIHEYGNPPSVYHVDLYRLETLGEARRLGLEELFEQSALVLVEWGERFPELMPHNVIQIRLAARGGDERVIEVEGLELHE